MSGTCLQENQRAVGSRDCTPRRHVQISPTLRPSAEAIIWRDSGLTHLLILETSCRGRRELGRSLWTQTLAVAIRGIPSSMRTLVLESDRLESLLKSTRAGSLPAHQPVTSNHYIVHQELTQCCRSIILQKQMNRQKKTHQEKRPDLWLPETKCGGMGELDEGGEKIYF